MIGGPLLPLPLLAPPLVGARRTACWAFRAFAQQAVK